MPRLLVVALAVISLLIVSLLSAHATSSFTPQCSDVKNDHYSGPCVAYMVDGVITGDETTVAP